MSKSRSNLLNLAEILVFGGILFALIAPLFSSESESSETSSAAFPFLEKHEKHENLHILQNPQGFDRFERKL
ncbi:hypothetical protein [Baaleninema sp.]|uniref:hypothetical protein n=1 Tax=Baaleninema sp. TaxID=3101197 RepID=UPI003D050760